MKASPRQQLLLLQLQDLDTAIARLRRRREQLPQRIELNSIGTETAEAKSGFMAVQRELDAQKADINRLESDIDLVQQRIERDRKMLAVSTSPREAQALEQELETLTRRRGELEDRELELMELNEETQLRFDEAANALNQVDQKHRALADELAEQEQKIDVEIVVNIDERAGLAAELQRDLLEHYEKLRVRSGIGAARLRGNISEASNMELAPAELAELREADADELLYCPHSGAILVRAE